MLLFRLILRVLWYWLVLWFLNFLFLIFVSMRFLWMLLFVVILWHYLTLILSFFIVLIWTVQIYSGFFEEFRSYGLINFLSNLFIYIFFWLSFISKRHSNLLSEDLSDINLKNGKYIDINQGRLQKLLELTLYNLKLFIHV